MNKIEIENAAIRLFLIPEYTVDAVITLAVGQLPRVRARYIVPGAGATQAGEVDIQEMEYYVLNGKRSSLIPNAAS